MFKNDYKKIMQSISPDPSLIAEVTARAERIENTRRRTPRRYRIPVVIGAVVVCVSLLAAVPVLAARYEPTYNVMYSISPKLAQYFKPVQLSCESNGIEMTVLSSYVHDDTAEIYITMSDLEGDRIDETVDLFDSERINIPFDNMSNCQLEGYDEETKTATFKVTVRTMNGETISNDKITFSVGQFLSHKRYDDNVKIPYNFKNAHGAVDTQDVYVSGGSVNKDESTWEYIDNPNYAKALVPSEPYENFPVNGIDLTGVAYIDGKLHIQTAVTDNLKNDNHCSIYLRDENGNIVCSDESFYFDNSNGAVVDGRVDYCEDIFDITISEIGNYTMWGDFVTCDTLTEGNWSVTYQIENQTDTIPQKDETELQNVRGSLETKKDACKTILNAVDYYDIVRGKIRTDLLNGDDYTIKYQVDMTDVNSTKAYEHTYSDKSDFDEEVYALNGEIDADGQKLSLDHVEEYDNINKTRRRVINEATSKADSEQGGDVYEKIFKSRGIKKYEYRLDPTNTNYASTVSIFPQELGFCLLSDFDKWEFGKTKLYFNRLCRQITGIVPEDCSMVNDAYSYSMLVDWSSGIILQSKFYDKNGRKAGYMDTKEISFDEEIKVKTPDDDKYKEYKYDR